MNVELAIYNKNSQKLNIENHNDFIIITCIKTNGYKWLVKYGIHRVKHAKNMRTGGTCPCSWTKSWKAWKLNIIVSYRYD